MNKNCLVLEQKKADLQVKLTILQESINNLKNELSHDEKNSLTINSNSIYPNEKCQIQNLISLSNEYNSANEFYKLKLLERNSLEVELIKEKKELEKMKLICSNLIKQKALLEQENFQYKKKGKELEYTMNWRAKKLIETKQKKNFLKQEIELLKVESITNIKFKYDNEIIEKNTDNQREFINEQLNMNTKRIQVLQIKIDNLNKDIFELENEINKIMKENEDMNNYNIDLENKIITMGENSKAINEKINFLQREIDETKDYIENSKKEKKILKKKLELLMEIFEKINIANVKINANLDIIKKSMEKKTNFMKKEEDFYSNCEKGKRKIIEVCKEINMFNELI